MTALIVSLVGVVFAGLILGPLGAVLGVRANRRLRSAGAPPSGAATAAVVIGCASTFLWLVTIGIVGFSVWAQVARDRVAKENPSRGEAPRPPADIRPDPARPPAPPPSSTAQTEPLRSVPAPLTAPEAIQPLPPPPASPVEKFALRVDATSWHDSALVDIREEIVSALKGLGSEETTDGGEGASIEVTYRETKGLLYKDQFEKEVGHGTNFSLHVAIRLKGFGRPVLDLRVDAEPAQFLGEVKNIDDASVEVLQAQDGYAYLEALVAASLGHRVVDARLVDALLTHDASGPALALLQWLRFSPESGEDQAAFAIVARDLPKLASLGDAAVGPIGTWVDRLLDRGDANDIPAAFLQLMGDLGKPELTPALLRLLDFHTSFLLSEDAAPQDGAEAIRVLEALAKAGDASALDPVTELTKAKHKKIAAAARKAAKKIRERNR